jgi:hypothetical protein
LFAFQQTYKFANYYFRPGFPRTGQHPPSSEECE